MRLVIPAGVAALALGGGPLPAQEAVGWRVAAPAPSALQPAPLALAANEVLFEVHVTGRARSPADETFLSLFFIAPGGTSAEARAAAEALSRRLLETARAHGAEPTSDYPALATPFVGGEGISTYGPDAESGSRAFTATGTVRLRLGDLQRIAELRTALENAGATNVTGPIHVLDDDTEARRAARLDAMTRAREEAERFAGAQNMRVVRLVRFSESLDAQAETMRALVSQFTGQSLGGPAEVETTVTAQVAFVLVPQ